MAASDLGRGNPGIPHPSCRDHGHARHHAHTPEAISNGDNVRSGEESVIDGQLWAVSGGENPEDDHDIWLINVDGGGLVQLTNSAGQDDCNPVWSPDGSKILFTSVRDGVGDVWFMDATGRGVRQMTTEQGTEPPDWSPDGQRFAYIARGRVWVAQADGTEPRRLTPGPDTESAPAWSPKGNGIVYRHQQAGDTWSLRIVSLETGQSRTLPIGQPGTPQAPAWQGTDE